MFFQKKLSDKSEIQIIKKQGVCQFNGNYCFQKGDNPSDPKHNYLRNGNCYFKNQCLYKWKKVKKNVKH